MTQSHYHRSSRQQRGYDLRDLIDTENQAPSTYLLRVTTS
jgi:hypothetical protein